MLRLDHLFKIESKEDESLSLKPYTLLVFWTSMYSVTMSSCLIVDFLRFRYELTSSNFGSVLLMLGAKYGLYRAIKCWLNDLMSFAILSC